MDFWIKSEKLLVWRYNLCSLASALHTNTNGSQATSKSGSPKKKNEIPELVMPVSKIKKDIFK